MKAKASIWCLAWRLKGVQRQNHPREYQISSNNFIKFRVFLRPPKWPCSAASTRFTSNIFKVANWQLKYPYLSNAPYVSKQVFSLRKYLMQDFYDKNFVTPLIFWCLAKTSTKILNQNKQTEKLLDNWNNKKRTIITLKSPPPPLSFTVSECWISSCPNVWWKRELKCRSCKLLYTYLM